MSLGMPLYADFAVLHLSLVYETCPLGSQKDYVLETHFNRNQVLQQAYVSYQ
jgi:hypothetical protein